MFTLLCISDAHKQFAPAVDEYMKRLSKSVHLVLLRPSRRDDPTSVIREETGILVDKLVKLPRPRIVLEKDGKELASEAFATYLEKQSQTATFIIGGPYGLDMSVMTPQVDLVLSFGKHTMPHGLALTVLLEQLWRAKCITEGRVYHY